MKHFLHRREVPVLLILFLLLVSPGPARAAFTTDDEKKLGKEFYEKLDASDVLIKDPLVNNYISALGTKILSQGHKAPFEFRFSVIRNSAVNAFATPGGYVYVNRGLVTLVENESELASVLAHEIAHVNARHIAQIIDKSTKINIAALAAILAGAFLGASGEVSAAITGFSMAAATTMTLKYSREHEEEADRLGMTYLVGAGYDGRAMLEFLKMMRRYEFYSNSIPSYFLTHPGTDERIQYLDAMIATGKKTNGASSIIGKLKRIQTALLVRETDPASSLKRFLDNLKKNPDDADDLYGLALTQEKLGLIPESQESFRKALKSAPEDADILRDMGISFFRIGNAESAVSCLEKAYRIDDGDVEMIIYLGRAYDAAGRYATALDFFKKAEKKKPEDADIHYNLAVAYGKTNSPGESHYHFGIYFKKKNKLESALFHFQAALRSFPEGDARARDIEGEIASLKEKERPRPTAGPPAPDGRNRGRSFP